MDDDDNPSSLSTILRMLTSCCYSSSTSHENFEQMNEQQRRAFSRRFQYLLGNIQAQAKAQTQHPRDQVFECVLRLYAHEVSTINN